MLSWLQSHDSSGSHQSTAKGRNKGERNGIQAIRFRDDATYSFKVNAVEDFSNNLSNAHHTVAVFGVQGSGKSTLLNHVFGTGFSVLSATTSPSLTTEGIWWSTAKTDGGPVLVMDVEGCDSVERDDNLDQKCALFALTVSDVLVFNVSKDHAAHRHAAGMPLMHGILRILLSEPRLKGHRRKRTVLVVVRDLSHPAPAPKPFHSAATAAIAAAAAAVAHGRPSADPDPISRMVHPSGLKAHSSAPGGGPAGLRAHSQIPRSGPSISKLPDSRTASVLEARPSGRIASNAMLGTRPSGLRITSSIFGPRPPSMLQEQSSVGTSVDEGPDGRELIEVLREQFNDLRADLEAAVGAEAMADFPEVEFRELPDKFKKGPGGSYDASGNYVSAAFQTVAEELRKMLTPGGAGSLLCEQEKRFEPSHTFQETWDFIDSHELLNAALPEDIVEEYIRDAEMDERVQAFKDNQRWQTLAAADDDLVPDFVAQAHEVWREHVKELNLEEPGPMEEAVLEELRMLVQPVYDNQLEVLRREVMAALERLSLAEVVPHGEFNTEALRVREMVATFFEPSSTEALKGTPWANDVRPRWEMERDVEEQIAVLRGLRLEGLLEDSRADWDTRLRQVVVAVVQRPSENVWPDLHAKSMAEVDTFRFLKTLEGLLGEGAARETLRHKMQDRLLGYVREAVQPGSQIMEECVVEWFRTEFRKLGRSHNGKVRDEKTCRDEALRRAAKMLEQFTVVCFSADGEPRASPGHGVPEFAERVIAFPDSRGAAPDSDSWLNSPSPTYEVLLTPRGLHAHLVRLVHLNVQDDDADKPSWEADVGTVMGAAGNAMRGIVGKVLSPVMGFAHMVTLLAVVLLAMVGLKFVGSITRDLSS